VNKLRLLQQLKADEGFRAKAYWDKKQWSYGYGCRAPGEGAVITEPEAAKLVEAHMNDSIAHFERIFKAHRAKFNDVRAEAFVNLIFNMGPGSVGHPENGGLMSFVNTMGLIFKNREVPWSQVADGMKASLWYRQVKNSGDDDGPGPDKGRGVRIVEEIRTGVKA
jgi:GH24 family phage-related lysozyme (muramidase)